MGIQAAEISAILKDQIKIRRARKCSILKI
jgi:hypothetical protein